MSNENIKAQKHLYYFASLYYLDDVLGPLFPPPLRPAVDGEAFEEVLVHGPCSRLSGDVTKASQCQQSWCVGVVRPRHAGCCYRLLL